MASGARLRGGPKGQAARSSRASGSKAKSGCLLCTWAAVHCWPTEWRGKVFQSSWYSVVASGVAVLHRFFFFTMSLSTWQPPPALVLCSGAPLLPFFSQLPSYSLIICAGWPDQSWHCHSPSQSLTQSFLLPAFCSLPPTSPKLQPEAPTKDFLIEFRVWSLSMPTPEFKDFPLNIFSFASLDVSLTIVWLMARAQWRKWAQPQPEIQYEFQCELTTYSLWPLSGHAVWNTWMPRLPFIYIRHHFYSLSCIHL